VLSFLLFLHCVIGFNLPHLGGLRRVRSSLSMKIKCSFIICPGFGNDEMDYRNPLKLGAEGSFVQTLKNQGVEEEDISVLKIKRYVDTME